MLVKGYYGISLKPCGPLFKTSPLTDAVWAVDFRLDAEVTPLFPFINGLTGSATFFEDPPFIRFLLDGFVCGLKPNSGVAAPFVDRAQALEFLERLIAFLNDIDVRKDTLEPNYRRWNPVVPVLDIFRLLPRTNCRTCGYASCLAFAAALSKQKTGPDRCPALVRPLAEQAVYPVVDSQGRILSTVVIDIDTAKIRRDMQEQQQYIAGLEKKLSDLAQADGTGEEINHHLPAPLTDREMEVLRLLVRGATNNEISLGLDISPHTVKSHVIHIFNKIGVNDRTQAAVWATRHHLV
ncbi:MAG: hypothetical protein HQK60_17365 [Deltaproteobacteria bacterium]|nr:hypothetical protein [Deltaproteobacteria bacterium]